MEAISVPMLNAEKGFCCLGCSGLAGPFISTCTRNSTHNSRSRALSTSRQSINSAVTSVLHPSHPQEPITDEEWREGEKVPRTWGFYVAFTAAILVWSVTVVSWLTVITHYINNGTLLALPTGGRAATLWYGYSLLEIPFSFYYRYLMWKGSKRPAVPDLDGDHLTKLLTKCLLVGLSPEEKDTVLHEREEDGQKAREGRPTHGLPALKRRRIGEKEAKILQNRLRRWFHHAPVDEIYAENVREWLSWAFAMRPLQEVMDDAAMKARIDEGFDMLIYRLNWSNIKPGYNPKTKVLRLNLDPMKVANRPLAYYLFCNSISRVVVAWLRIFHGFKYEYSGKCTYLVKAATVPPNHSDKQKLPILFLHGLGIGIGQYVFFLTRLVKHKEGVVILLQPNISGEISHPQFLKPPNKDEQADATIALLNKLNMPKVMSVSHSNGTMVIGWLLRKDPSRYAHNILVDPVCFRMWEGASCYAFIHRRWTTFLHVFLGYFIAREVGTARTIARDFRWSDMLLWADEFESVDPSKFHVIFGEKDLLVDVPSCVTYLKESGVSDEAITVIPKYQHGIALFLEGKGLKLVCKHAGFDK